ncbi:hypothetical protein PCANC_06915 [Puccinia coronata f. sp. avenae]|uniref:Uncharacterized protein n=1 Tax=Puccinia coronata f. sp. avenae TaxID=200324 RepID=A0A2N5SWX2_9BASI|nr:hypothetical protein PCANC_09093 [Puccinia coronata f. sp. avenae]PLW49238.1 hypothetical protein PCANC_06915 [Puccinia coronata f. sp. avenae]
MPFKILARTRGCIKQQLGPKFYCCKSTPMSQSLKLVGEVLVFQTQLIRSMIKKLLLAKQLRKVLKQTMLQ